MTTLNMTIAKAAAAASARMICDDLPRLIDRHFPERDIEVPWICTGIDTNYRVVTSTRTLGSFNEYADAVACKRRASLRVV